MPEIDSDPLKPCLDCGLPGASTRCADCESERPKLPSTGRKSGLSATRRGYDTSWRRLSKKAISLQPWCTECGTDQDLTGDHLRWPARSLEDVAVLCRPCNSAKGAIRSNPGGKGLARGSGPQGFTGSSSLTPGGDRG